MCLPREDRPSRQRPRIPPVTFEAVMIWGWLLEQIQALDRNVAANLLPASHIPDRAPPPSTQGGVESAHQGAHLYPPVARPTARLGDLPGCQLVRPEGAFYAQ